MPAMPKTSAVSKKTGATSPSGAPVASRTRWMSVAAASAGSMAMRLARVGGRAGRLEPRRGLADDLAEPHGEDAAEHAAERRDGGAIGGDHRRDASVEGDVAEKPDRPVTSRSCTER